MSGENRDGIKGTITYNGELYNYQALKQSLSSQWHFRSECDTEVFLAGLTHHGPNFLRDVNGMFALAHFDHQSRQLSLIRDRVGKKPLYIYHTRELLVFASELKAIKALGVATSANEQALSFYRWLGYVPSEMSAYQECSKLPASSFWRLDLRKKELSPPSPQPYWDPLSGYQRRFDGDYADAIDEFLYLLDEATRVRLDADVPIGAFLSGGIDSSLVVSSVVKLNHSDVTAFTIQPDDLGFDESHVARNTAAQLGIDIEVISLRAEDYERQIARIPQHYDEPFCQRSQIAMMAMSERARENVKVVLTGDGGDEVFLGYPWMSYPERLFRYRRLLDLVPFSKYAAGKLLATELGRTMLHLLVGWQGLNTSNVDTKVAILEHLLEAVEPTDIYDDFQAEQLPSFLTRTDRRSIGPDSLLQHAQQWYPSYSWGALDERSVPEQLGGLDLVTYLRDGVLVKVDRATMAFGLEARSPLLDYRIIEFGQSLPLEFKISDGTHKRILRDALARRLKGGINNLKKQGFGIPMPTGLPEGPTANARWNKFVEKQWRVACSVD